MHQTALWNRECEMFLLFVHNVILPLLLFYHAFREVTLFVTEEGLLIPFDTALMSFGTPAANIPKLICQQMRERYYMLRFFCDSVIIILLLWVYQVSFWKWRGSDVKKVRLTFFVCDIYFTDDWTIHSYFKLSQLESIASLWSLLACQYVYYLSRFVLLTVLFCFIKLTLDPQKPTYLMLERGKVPYLVHHGIGNILLLHTGHASNEWH